MEVILTKPSRLGAIGNLVNVKDGFARNYLLPKEFAIRATEHNKQLIDQKKYEFELKNQKAKQDAENLSSLIDGKELMFIKQSSDDGRLFGSVNGKEISAYLSKIIASGVPNSAISIAPIKTTGVFPVSISLHPEVISSILVIIARSDSEANDALRAYKTQKEEKDLL